MENKYPHTKFWEVTDFYRNGDFFAVTVIAKNRAVLESQETLRHMKKIAKKNDASIFSENYPNDGSIFSEKDPIEAINGVLRRSYGFRMSKEDKLRFFNKNPKIWHLVDGTFTEVGKIQISRDKYVKIEVFEYYGDKLMSISFITKENENEDEDEKENWRGTQTFYLDLEGGKEFVHILMKGFLYMPESNAIHESC